MGDSSHYSESIARLEKAVDLRERLPDNVELLRSEVETLSAQSSEQSQQMDRIIELLERNSEILESIDHAHYYKVRPESVQLTRIIILLVVIAAIGLASLFL
ncbi:hypothetical protein [Phaeobacter sp. CAU 1743]|uniref:hypothetical protein n=1 Tax=Rhodobacterales TaxID=204455 RepID=UPI00325B5370